jgi:hypothetical protein
MTGKFFFIHIISIIYSINHYLEMLYTTKGDDGGEIEREWAQGDGTRVLQGARDTDASRAPGMFFSFSFPFFTVLIHFYH